MSLFGHRPSDIEIQRQVAQRTMEAVDRVEASRKPLEIALADAHGKVNRLENDLIALLAVGYYDPRRMAVVLPVDALVLAGLAGERVLSRYRRKYREDGE